MEKRTEAQIQAGTQHMRFRSPASLYWLQRTPALITIIDYTQICTFLQELFTSLHIFTELGVIITLLLQVLRGAMNPRYNDPLMHVIWLRLYKAPGTSLRTPDGSFVSWFRDPAIQ